MFGGQEEVFSLAWVQSVQRSRVCQIKLLAAAVARWFHCRSETYALSMMMWSPQKAEGCGTSLNPVHRPGFSISVLHDEGSISVLYLPECIRILFAIFEKQTWKCRRRCSFSQPAPVSWNFVTRKSSCEILFYNSPRSTRLFCQQSDMDIVVGFDR